MSNPRFWRMLGYYGFIYVLILGFTFVAYPLARQYAAPVVSMLVPLDPGNNIMKTFWAITGVYWVMVGGFILLNLKPPAAS